MNAGSWQGPFPGHALFSSLMELRECDGQLYRIVTAGLRRLFAFSVGNMLAAGIVSRGSLKENSRSGSKIVTTYAACKASVLKSWASTHPELILMIVSLTPDWF